MVESDGSPTEKSNRFCYQGRSTLSPLEQCIMTETVVYGSLPTIPASCIFTKEEWTSSDKLTVFRAMKPRPSMKTERIISGLQLTTAWIDFGTLPSLPSRSKRACRTQETARFLQTRMNVFGFRRWPAWLGGSHADFRLAPIAPESSMDHRDLL